ncbi:MAG: hypothetical protein ACRD1K_08870 [Acidimicrobiales bacterium]
MRTPVEDRLREALARQAETTKVDPGGWERIESRLGPRRWLSGVVRPGVLVPALAVVALVVAVVTVSQRGQDSRVRAADAPGRLYLVPTLEGFKLENVLIDPPVDERVPRVTRVFGRRSPDGVTLNAAVGVLVSSVLAPRFEQDGMQVVEWRQGSQFVTLVTYGLSSAEAAAAEASLRAGPAEVTPPAAPADFETIFEVTTDLVASRPQMFVDQTWRSAAGGEFHLTVTEALDASLDAIAWGQPGSRLVAVRGTDGLVSADGDTMTWVERTGIAVTVYGPDLGPAELVAIAGSLRPIDGDAWKKLIVGVPDRLPPDSGSAVEISSGERDGVFWQALVHRFVDPDGRELVCLLLKSTAGSGSLCTPPGVLPPGTVADVEQRDGFLAGRVSPEVTRLRILLAGGSTVDTGPVGRDTGFPTAYLVVQLPPGATAETVVVQDDAGRELSRSKVTPMGN